MRLGGQAKGKSTLGTLYAAQDGRKSRTPTGEMARKAGGRPNAYGTLWSIYTAMICIHTGARTGATG